MAQNVESNVNIKVNADTGQAVSAMDTLWKAYSKLNDETMRLKNSTDSIDGKSLKILEETYKQLSDTANAFYESQLISSKQMDTFAESFNKSWLKFLDTANKDNPLYTSFEQMEQKALTFQKILGSLENELTKLGQFNVSNIFDANGINKIQQANEMFDRLFGTIQTLRSNGTIDFSQRKELFNTLINGFNQYRKALDDAGISVESLTKRQEILSNLSSGNLIKSLQEQSNIGKTTVNDARKAAEEEQKRQEAINKINKEYEETARKQQQQEELEKRITAEAEKRAKLEEEFNKRREDAQKRQAELQENLNKTYNELGGGGVSAPDDAFAQSINDLAAQAGNESNASFGELFSNLNISDKLLSVFANKIGISTTELKALGEALGVSAGSLLAYAGAAAAAIGGIKLLVDNTKEMINTFKNVGAAIGEDAFNGIEWFVDSLQNMVDMAEQAIQTLDKLAEAGTTIERAFLTTSAYIGQDATDQVYSFIQSISGASNTMFASINDVVAAAGSMGLASDQLVEATENMTIMGRNLGVLIGDTQKAFTDLGQTISKGYVGRNSILYRIFTKQEIEQVRKLSNEVERYNFILERAGRVQELYNAYIETAAGKVSLMKMQYQELMNNIGLVALNLYAIVAPVLTKILTIANQLLSVLISVFGWEPKSVGFTSIASDIGNSLDNVAESASKANKQLASFDDVIQINDSKSGGSALGDIDTAGLGDFGSMLDGLIDDSNELTDIWAHFKELMEQGDYFGAGKEFMQVFADQLRQIDWDSIKTKASETGKAIAEFLNGIFDVSSLDGLLNWKTIGETIAEALNTVIAAVGSFLKEFDFKMMGKALGTAWKSLWDNLDIEGAAEALYEAFMGVFEFVNGWLQGGGLSRAAEGIAQFITSLFSNFKIEADTDEIVNAVTGVIDDIINAIKTVVDALTSADVKKVVSALITKLVTSFKENAADWGTKLHDIANDILDFIIDGINTADKAGLDEAVVTFLSNLKLGELVSKWMQIKWQKWSFEFRTQATAFFIAVAGFIGQAIKNLLLIIGSLLFEIVFVVFETIATIGGALVGAGEQAGVWLRGKIDEIISNVTTFFSDVVAGFKIMGEAILSSVSSIGEDLGSEFSTIGETIKDVFTSIWDFVSGIFDPQNWIDLGTAAIDALWSAIKSIWNNTIGSWSFDIPGFSVMGKEWDGIHFSMPKLATGGIVTSATTALIGEAGKEAVLPLDNNTQWMDKLAAKINNNGNNAGGTVRVQLADKPFYTRAEMYEFGSLIVESLKAYGLNIAMV